MISENQFKYCRLDLLQGLTIFLNQSEKGIHKKGGCTAMICNGDSTEWDHWKNFSKDHGVQVHRRNSGLQKLFKGSVKWI
jgi:hypothetical protein